ncbi:hypothetical protein OHAE_3568 [Ochrobactrum soli]|uniref:Uncharacterized protein n=1 Tax=Ochrobactrum soli TaxID=2448455 RepID=A0A2P9HHR5_9HYPH|nr:hypothetical protein OHAE_3568 [[Ochrobactrum] soli]
MSPRSFRRRYSDFISNLALAHLGLTLGSSWAFTPNKLTPQLFCWILT